MPTVTATSNITTNSIGRQRPSPLKPRPYEFTSASPSATARASAAFSLTSGNSAVIRSSTARHNSSTAAHIQQPPGTAAVSVREFNAWLAKNRAWEQKHKDKVSDAYVVWCGVKTKLSFTFVRYITPTDSACTRRESGKGSTAGQANVS